MKIAITLILCTLALTPLMAKADLYAVCVQPILDKNEEIAKVVLTGPIVAKIGASSPSDISEEELATFEKDTMNRLKKYAIDKKLLKGGHTFDEEDSGCSDVNSNLQEMNDAVKAYIEMYRELDVKIYQI